MDARWKTARPFVIAGTVVAIPLAALGVLEYSGQLLVFTVYAVGVLCCVIAFSVISRLCGLRIGLPTTWTRGVVLTTLLILAAEVLSVGTVSTLRRSGQGGWLFGDFERRPAAQISCSYTGELEVMYIPRTEQGPDHAEGWGMFLTRDLKGWPFTCWSSAVQQTPQPDGWTVFAWTTGPTIHGTSGPKNLWGKVTGRYAQIRLHFVAVTILLLLYPCLAFPGVIRRRRQNRRRAQGLCPRCGYNLTGNVSGACPECGTPVGPVV